MSTAKRRPNIKDHPDAPVAWAAYSKVTGELVLILTNPESAASKGYNRRYDIVPLRRRAFDV